MEGGNVEEDERAKERQREVWERRMEEEKEKKQVKT